MDDTFFEESREQSQIKSRIVAKYFWAWAKVIIPTAKTHGNRIAYIDLFSGPGRYKDGTQSTPSLVLEKAINDPDMRRMLVTLFNDKDKENTASLAEVVDAIPGVEQLKYKPLIQNQEVGADIVKMLESVSLVPSFLFADPWGYKGLSLALIKSVLRNWGCDCVFFFNYRRINMGLSNDAMRGPINDLFTQTRADVIRQKLGGLGAEDRETLIIEELTSALKEMGARFVLPFTFKTELGTRTTHHIIFTTKNFKGYEIMKGIMAKESSEHDQGVASFRYSSAARQYPTPFELSRPLDDLEQMLLQEFSGRKLTMKEVYESHSIGRPYIETNYKKVLAGMEAAGKIKAVPPAEARRTGTFASHVTVTFPQGVRK